MLTFQSPIKSGNSCSPKHWRFTSCSEFYGLENSVVPFWILRIAVFDLTDFISAAGGRSGLGNGGRIVMEVCLGRVCALSRGRFHSGRPDVQTWYRCDRIDILVGWWSLCWFIGDVSVISRFDLCPCMGVDWGTTSDFWHDRAQSVRKRRLGEIVSGLTRGDQSYVLCFLVCA